MDLVTGGTGIVGSHILEELTRNGKAVRAIKRASSDIQLVQSIFEHYNNPNFNSIEWVLGDITDIPSIEEAMIGVENVYHAAAIVSFHKKDRQKMHKINVEGTANIVNLCLANSVKKLGYISSIASLGRTAGQEWYSEKDTWKTSKQNSYYAITKYTAENEVWRGCEEGLNSVMVNPGVILGPGDMRKSSGTLFGTIYKGLNYYTKGINGFVDARDVSRSIIQLVQSDISKERYLCVGENLPFKTFFELVASSLNKTAPSKLAKPWLTGIVWRLAGFISFISGKKPVITKESVSTSHFVNQYNSDKLKQAIDFKFTPIKEACENTGAFFLKRK
jgi:nucleoside-diphosphate-sugar epimerase